MFTVGNCIVCGTPTKRFQSFAGAYLCSEECDAKEAVNAFVRRLKNSPTKEAADALSNYTRNTIKEGKWKSKIVRRAFRTKEGNDKSNESER